MSSKAHTSIHKRMPARIGLAGLLLLVALSCLPGGVINKGGRATNPAFFSNATLLNNSSYRVLCWDPIEENRRKELARRPVEEKGAAEKKQDTGGPPVREVLPAEYKGGCEREGMSSTFFLFGMFPVTAPLNPEYAIGTAIQELEGDSMVGIQAWHEEHPYSLLGRVSVLRIRGTVIRFKQEEELPRKPVAPARSKRRGTKGR